MGINSDFIVESNHFCFVCLKQTETSPEIKGFIKQEFGEPDHDPTHFPTYSLQSLSRFLGMDMKKVFKSRKDIAPHLLIKVEGAALKAELCEYCSHLISRFSQLHRHFEKFKIELMSSVRDIHEQFMEADEQDKIEDIIKMTQDQEHSITNLLDKLDILKMLRTQAIEKSSSLISSSSPRIKMEKLTMKKVCLKKLMIKQNSKLHGQPTKSIALGNIKRECPTGSSAHKDGDYDDNSDYFEMHGDDATTSDLSDVEPNLESGSATGKVEVADFHHGPHTSKELRRTKLVSRQNIPSLKLATTKDFNPIKVNGKFQCNICLNQYTTKASASQHFNSVHLKLRYDCRSCHKTFASQMAYKRHHKSVHQGAGRKCTKCNQLFVTKHNLKRHQLLQRCVPIYRKCGGERHCCKLCDKSYSQGRDLKLHIDTVHLGQAAKHVCSQCARVFTYISNLKAHIKSVHQDIREHRCNICPNSYTTISSLKYHKITAHASGSLPH